jgi:hypothetical protein
VEKRLTHDEQVVKGKTDKGNDPGHALLAEEVVGAIGDVSALRVGHAESPENVGGVERSQTLFERRRPESCAIRNRSSGIGRIDDGPVRTTKTVVIMPPAMPMI